MNVCGNRLVNVRGIAGIGSGRRPLHSFRLVKNVRTNWQHTAWASGTRGPARKAVSRGVYSMPGRYMQRTSSVSPIRLGVQKMSSTASKSTKKTIQTSPPLVVRSALVATTTAIGTPAFPVVGLAKMVIRWVVPEQQLRIMALGTTGIVTGILVVLNIAGRDWLPVAYSYSQLFLPFALVNGAIAGVAYTALDVALGVQVLANAPWAGAAIGAVVGGIGPWSGWYDKAFAWCYELPSDVHIWDTVMNNTFILPMSVTTGAIVGGILHPLLYFPIRGVPNVHWVNFSAPLLVAASLAAWHLYSGDMEQASKHLYMTDKERRQVQLVSRFNLQEWSAGDWGGPTVGYQTYQAGQQARHSVRKKNKEIRDEYGRDAPTAFDNSRKAWVYELTYGFLNIENQVSSSVGKEIDWTEKSRRLLYGDGVVAFLMAATPKGKKKNSTQKRSKKEVQQSLVDFLSDLEGPKTRRSSSERQVRSMKLASYGVALLMHHRLHGETAAGDLPKDIEEKIRKLVPGIMLFREDETEEIWTGCSVEAQLQAMGWGGLPSSGKRSWQLMVSRWDTGIRQHHNATLARDVILVATTGICAMLVAAVLAGGGGGTPSA